MLGDLISKWHTYMGKKDLESGWKQLMKSNTILTVCIGNDTGMVVFSNEPEVVGLVNAATEEVGDGE